MISCKTLIPYLTNGIIAYYHQLLYHCYYDYFIIITIIIVIIEWRNTNFVQ